MREVVGIGIVQRKVEAGGLGHFVSIGRRKLLGGRHRGGKHHSRIVGMDIVLGEPPNKITDIVLSREGIGDRALNIAI